MQCARVDDPNRAVPFIAARVSMAVKDVIDSQGVPRRFKLPFVAVKYGKPLPFQHKAQGHYLRNREVYGLKKRKGAVVRFIRISPDKGAWTADQFLEDDFAPDIATMDHERYAAAVEKLKSFANRAATTVAVGEYPDHTKVSARRAARRPIAPIEPRVIPDNSAAQVVAGRHQIGGLAMSHAAVEVE